MFKEKGQGAALVFLPGFCGSGESFSSQLDAFAGQFHTLAWTMPGFAGRHALDICNVGALTLALKAELDAKGIEKCHIVGHAIGGMIAQEMALRYPERVLSAVFYATSPSLGGPGSAFSMQFLADRLAPVEAGLNMSDIVPALMTTMVSPHADPDGVRSGIELLSNVPVAAYKQLLDAAVQFDRRNDLGALTMPALCLAGEADRQVPALIMERMAEKIPSAQFAIVRRAGHEAHLEQPAVFNALLGAFLADLKAQAA